MDRSKHGLETALKAVTIILIEDDDGHARLVEKNLRRAGVSNQIIRCADGESAVQCLFGGGCAGHLLVLLDLNLPDMSGIDILQRLKTDSKLGRTPVVVLTTTDDRIDVQRCYDLGCNVYITKPVDYEHFSNAVQQLGLFLAVVQIPETA
jgi:CheY-like chemotaxis protein